MEHTDQGEDSTYDVIVIGGGPAGSTAATLVASQGRKVLLLERSEIMGFKIGESLMPGTYWTFKRLEVLDKLKASRFPRKSSVQFFSSSGKGSAPFYFSQNDPHESSVTWQVLRSEFDQMLLDNAKEKGANICQGSQVLKVLFEDDRAVGVQAKVADGSIRNFNSRVVVDASGQSSLIARRLKFKAVEPTLRKASIFTHFEGAHRDVGIDEGATLIMQTRDKDSWFWYIPLPDNRVSVGVVGDLEVLFKDRKKRAQRIFEAEVEKCMPVKERITGAEQAFPVQVTQDFSYRSSQISGEGWVLAGDAFGFLDPIYSSGVFLALKSGEMIADAIDIAFGKEDFSGAQLGCWKEEFLVGMEAIRKLVYAFYTRDFSFAHFLKAHPECLQGVVDILSGNVYIRDVTYIFEPMGEMCDLPTDSFYLESVGA